MSSESHSIHATTPTPPTQTNTPFRRKHMTQPQLLHRDRLVLGPVIEDPLGVVADGPVPDDEDEIPLLHVPHALQDEVPLIIEGRLEERLVGEERADGHLRRAAVGGVDGERHLVERCVFAERLHDGVCVRAGQETHRGRRGCG